MEKNRDPQALINLSRTSRKLADKLSQIIWRSIEITSDELRFSDFALDPNYVFGNKKKAVNLEKYLYSMSVSQLRCVRYCRLEFVPLVRNGQHLTSFDLIHPEFMENLQELDILECFTSDSVNWGVLAKGLKAYPVPPKLYISATKSELLAWDNDYKDEIFGYLCGLEFDLAPDPGTTIEKDKEQCSHIFQKMARVQAMVLRDNIFPLMETVSFLRNLKTLVIQNMRYTDIFYWLPATVEVLIVPVVVFTSRTSHGLDSVPKIPHSERLRELHTWASYYEGGLLKRLPFRTLEVFSVRKYDETGGDGKLSTALRVLIQSILEDNPNLQKFQIHRLHSIDIPPLLSRLPVGLKVLAMLNVHITFAEIFQELFMHTSDALLTLERVHIILFDDELWWPPFEKVLEVPYDTLRNAAKVKKMSMKFIVGFARGMILKDNKRGSELLSGVGVDLNDGGFFDKHSELRRAPQRKVYLKQLLLDMTNVLKLEQ